MNNFGVNIIGAGKYLPKNLITNQDLSELVDTNDEWIKTRTGINTRHIIDDETTHSMGAKASLDALKNANLAPEDVDIIFATTVSNDYSTPSLACLVANDIGVPNAVCIDVNCACAGFVYAVDIARRYLMDNEYKTALIVSSEMLSKLTDFTDRATCILFGDGAGACVLQKSESLFSCHLGADATGSTKLFARGIHANNPFRSTPFDPLSDGLAESNGHAIYQDGKEVYKFATKTMPMAVKEACDKASVRPDQLKLIFPHQANLRIIETAAKNLKLPIENFYINIQNHGNMSSACIPICLAEAMEKNLLEKGDKICLVGFGAGLTYGSIVMEW